MANKIVQLEYQEWFKHNIHHIKNLIALLGFLSTIAFRLWGISALLVVLVLVLLKAQPKQYLGVFIADILASAILYFHDGFYTTSYEKVIGHMLIYCLFCLVYWLVTLEQRPNNSFSEY